MGGGHLPAVIGTTHQGLSLSLTGPAAPPCAGSARPQPRPLAQRCAGMEQRITIARPAAEVFAYLADPTHLRDWLPQLRREETDLPDTGLESDRAAGAVRWSFDPAGEWRGGAGGGGGGAEGAPPARRRPR